MPQRPSDLVNDARLDTEFFAANDETEHTWVTFSRSARSRRVQTLERWKRHAHLGEGSYGRVWLERCIRGPAEGKLRAVKRIKKDPSSDSQNYDRELEAIMKFSHKKYAHCFVRSFGWFENDEAVFISMEYLKYGDLQKHMLAPFPEEEARQIVLQIAEGLEFMHTNGFAHRDLKPANILVYEPKPAWWVKISDFGISKRSEELTALRTIGIGTRGYIAPEVLGLIASESEMEDDPTYTCAVDIWPLGEIAVRLITKQPTFSDPGKLARYVLQGTPFPTTFLDECGVNQDCVSFVKSTMVADPKLRLTASEAIRHRWLDEQSNENSIEPNADNKALDISCHEDEGVINLYGPLAGGNFSTDSLDPKYLSDNSDGLPGLPLSAPRGADLPEPSLGWSTASHELSSSLPSMEFSAPECDLKSTGNKTIVLNVAADQTPGNERSTLPAEALPQAPPSHERMDQFPIDPQSRISSTKPSAILGTSKEKIISTVGNTEDELQTQRKEDLPKHTILSEQSVTCITKSPKTTPLKSCFALKGVRSQKTCQFSTSKEPRGYRYATECWSSWNAGDPKLDPRHLQSPIPWVKFEPDGPNAYLEMVRRYGPSFTKVPWTARPMRNSEYKIQTHLKEDLPQDIILPEQSMTDSTSSPKTTPLKSCIARERGRTQKTFRFSALKEPRGYRYATECWPSYGIAGDRTPDLRSSRSLSPWAKFEPDGPEAYQEMKRRYGPSFMNAPQTARPASYYSIGQPFVTFLMPHRANTPRPAPRLLVDELDFIEREKEQGLR